MSAACLNTEKGSPSVGIIGQVCRPSEVGVGWVKEIQLSEVGMKPEK